VSSPTPGVIFASSFRILYSNSAGCTSFKLIIDIQASVLVSIHPPRISDDESETPKPETTVLHYGTPGHISHLRERAATNEVVPWQSCRHFFLC
jgi:hypothetical protein